MIQRNLTPRLREALADSPVVLVNGARQTGKTTLARSLIDDAYPATYLTLDDSTVLSAAASDPEGFVAGLSGPVILDEVQHAPGLFPAIKASVDRDRRPGRFLLTGSTNILLLPQISESLAGRMEILTLWPLAQSEIASQPSSVTDMLFSETLPSTCPAVQREDLIERLLVGGYPEPLSRKMAARRRAWFTSYITTILQRDVRDISRIEGLHRMPQLLALLASRSASLLNLTGISTTAGIPYATLTRYMAVLEATFLVQLLPAWSGNLGSRLVKTPKLLLNDTGLLSSLLGLDGERLQGEGTLLGPILENFVAMELRKDAGWSAVQPGLYHFRTHARQEVDLVLEGPGGRVVGVEVKAAGSVNPSDFKGLRALAHAVGDRFVRGVVLYSGTQTIPFGDDLHAVPLSLLWRKA